MSAGAKNSSALWTHPQLPIEIWMHIVDLGFEVPQLFSFCSINIQWNNAIHKHFKNIGMIDVKKYTILDKTKSIDEQISFLVGVKDHRISGMNCTYQRGLYPKPEVLTVNDALQKCIHFNRFETLRLDERAFNSKLFRAQFQSLLDQSVSNAIYLTELDITIDKLAIINLSRLPMLKVLKVVNVQIDHCVASFVHFELKRSSDIIEFDQIIQIIQTSASTLECLMIDGFTLGIFPGHQPTEVRLTKLKKLVFGKVGSAQPKLLSVDISESCNLVHLQLALDDPNGMINVVGFNPTNLKLNYFKVNEVLGGDIVSSFLGNINLESFNSIEHLQVDCTAQAVGDLLNRLGDDYSGCALRSFTVGLFEFIDPSNMTPITFSDRLVNLILSAQNLHFLVFHVGVIDLDTFIRIILSKFSVEIEMVYYFKVAGCLKVDLLQRLFDSLSTVESIIVRNYKFIVNCGICQIDNSDKVNELKNVISECFNVHLK